MTLATSPTPSTSTTAPIDVPEEECRRCRATRAVARIALFIVGGIVFSLVISWIVARVPVIGALLSIVGIVFMARTLLRLFTTTTPVRAATQLGISLGTSSLISAIVAWIAR